MTIPAAIFGLVISFFYGALFHLIFNGGFGRLVVFMFFSTLGFWIGQLISHFLGPSFGVVGPLDLFAATVGSWIFMVIGLWLSRDNKPQA
jgi:hypothetical protein